MFNTQNAGLAMTVFWSGVLIGRIIGIMFLGKVRSSYLMLVFSILSLVALIFIFNTTSPFSVLISYAIGGLGFSVLFPLLVSKGGTVFSNGSRTIITILYVSSTIGFSVTPFLTRFVSQNNLVLSVWLSFIFMFIVFLFLIAYIILEKSLFRKGT
jgi:fucose permease